MPKTDRVKVVLTSTFQNQGDAPSCPNCGQITVRNLLNMASGLSEEGVPEDATAFDVALGHADKSPFAKLKADPGKEFAFKTLDTTWRYRLESSASGGTDVTESFEAPDYGFFLNLLTPAKKREEMSCPRNQRTPPTYSRSSGPLGRCGG